jgi:hypothetical protein
VAVELLEPPVDLKNVLELELLVKVILEELGKITQVPHLLVPAVVELVVKVKMDLQITQMITQVVAEAV